MELIIAFLIFACVAASAAAVMQARGDAEVATQMRLDRASGRVSENWSMAGAPSLRGSRLSNIPLIERTLQNLDMARGIETRLIRADWNLRVSEYFGVQAVAALTGFLILNLVFHSIIFALVGGAFGAAIPWFLLRRGVGKRTRKIEKQLVEALSTISNSLKAGFGLLQALDQCAKNVQDPIAKELKQTIRDTQVGSSIEEAVLNLSARTGSYDLDIVVTAILVQRNVGGNLSEILDGVANTMRERERIRGEISALTAQQRMTGYVIGALPICIGLLFFFLNPDYMKPLFTTSVGHLLVGGALVLETIGGFIIKKIVAIDV